MARWCLPGKRSASAAAMCSLRAANTACMRWCKKRSQCPARRMPSRGPPAAAAL
ncbi:coat protein [Xanthomonas citri pv. malvacearum]|uniref:Coat protein n=1 Tax=Xanthomonas campestris pv. malvacearum TaxID=86040 RepID=A0AA45BTQ6_XANCM|nr:coat protein [Xanthomonas citri pv. malvacearum]PUE91022.1 coat protein [Xanthomonas citri pv. malvacearum]QGL18116.1 coat protein [Xanthomonas citri pv. malvacearum]